MMFPVFLIAKKRTFSEYTSDFIIFNKKTTIHNEDNRHPAVEKKVERNDIYNMRRNYDHIIEDDSVVFYAPLTQGDLTDHISGNTFITTGSGNGGTATWDANQNAYYFYKSGGIGQAGRWEGLSLGLDTNHVVATLICDTYGNTNDTWYRGACIGAYSTTNQNTHLFPNVTLETSKGATMKAWHSVVVSYCDDGYGRIYLDGNLYNTENVRISRSKGTLTPSFINRYVSIGRADGNTPPTNCYVSNLIILNRALTAEEVQEL